MYSQVIVAGIAHAETLSLLLMYTDGAMEVTLTDRVFAVDEGISVGEVSVCVDLIGSNLERNVVVTVTTTFGTATGLEPQKTILF